MPGEKALQSLIQGNKRYVEEMLDHPRRDREMRLTSIETQKPFAVVLTCSDSRVIPEILFDQGIGDLFIIRLAGNVIGSLSLESLKFAVIELGCTLIVVMGHENCGAVKAVMEKKGKELLPKIYEQIEPYVINEKSLAAGVKSNVLHVVEGIKKSFQELIYNKKLKVIGAVYHFQSGKVEFFDEKS
jgi:carbonic anhydrase